VVGSRFLSRFGKSLRGHRVSSIWLRQVS
jgi:hypothetical protein